MSSLFKNLFIALCISGLLAVLYYLATHTGNGGDETGIDNSEVTQKTNKILADINRMNQYSMDVSIMDDERFKTLHDFDIAIPDVTTGRTNPFAPIE